MEDKSRLRRVIDGFSKLPAPLRRRVITAVMGRVIPFVGTADVQIVEMTPERVVARIGNRRRVRNHIGGVHAAAMALVAETASGLVVVMNVPDSRVPVIKSMRVQYKKRLKGGLRVEARLTEEQRASIAAQEKGEVTVQVSARDDGGQEPIVCEMVWAWLPKKRTQAEVPRETGAAPAS